LTPRFPRPVPILINQVVRQAKRDLSFGHRHSPAAVRRPPKPDKSVWRSGRGVWSARDANRGAAGQGLVGHPPGYGVWQYERLRDLFVQMRAECRKRSLDFAFPIEEPHKLAIPFLDVYHARDCAQGHGPRSLGRR
jgi:hypothetical protein